MTLSDFLGGAQKIATTGAQVYTTVQGVKLQENAAPQPVAPAPSSPMSGTTGTALPWYKAKWVIPAAIGAGVMLLVAIFRRR